MTASQNNDSIAKICPIMSRPFRPSENILKSEDWDRLEEAGPNGIYLDGIIGCQEGKCAAWIPPCDIYSDAPDEEKEGTMNECPGFERDCEISRPCCAGYCALIYPVRRS